MYNLTLCNTDGTLMAVVPDAPMLPRFLHIADGMMGFADHETPDEFDAAVHVDTFKRVASSVWVDDERDALFVRVMA